LQRELLNAFLGSASEVLNPDGGKIQVALCEGQGGATVATNEEWRQSWTAALFAAENGLLLVDVKPYEVLQQASCRILCGLLGLLTFRILIYLNASLLTI